MRDDSVICVTWLIRMCDMTDSYVWHDAFICVPPFIRVTWRILVCDMTHSYVRQDSFICVTLLICMCAMTHSHLWHDSFLCATWLTHVCNMMFCFVFAGKLFVFPCNDIQNGISVNLNFKKRCASWKRRVYVKRDPSNKATRDSQKRPRKETYKRDLYNNLEKTHKRDLHTCK